MLDQRGGIISKVFIIPAGVVVIIGVFTLGYYVGTDQARKTAPDEKPAALPEVVSQYLPKKEEFTFYKTLADKGDKTVSIELKPKQKPEQGTAPAADVRPKQHDPVKAPESRTDKPVIKPASHQTEKVPHQTASSPKEPAPVKQSPSKVRYTIQVGAYPEKAMAEEEARNMKKRGYAAFLVTTDIPEKGKWYRVRVGSFANKQSAEKLAKELKSKEGVDGFITME